MKKVYWVIVLLLLVSCVTKDREVPVQKQATIAMPHESKKPVNLGDREGHDMTDPIPAEDIPPAPTLEVAEALESMHIQPGFVLEAVASEPDVFSPVAISFDGDGRIWVAEMTTFMPDLDGNNEEVPKGNIAILEDTNNDGKADKRTVFLDDVVLPRTIVPVKGGILYSDQMQLYFAEVLAGDQLGIREVVDPTYAKGGSVEHKPNGMLYALDNWYYNAKSDRRYKMLPLDSELPDGAEEIYRNRYWKMIKGYTEFRGQWGISMDDYGRLYHNGNSSPAMGEYLRPNSLRKNPGLIQDLEANSLGGNRVYPVRINPGVNRGYLPDILISEGENKGKLANFTAASGNEVYRGDQFPVTYYGVSFTPEPGANLISARRILEQQGKLSGEQLYPEAEILASTDERFRPVNLNTAPDGSLYIVDMYHGVIQHKEFLTTYLRKQAEARDLQYHNNTMGRIYRLRWADKPLGEQPRLLSKSAAELVPYLAHSNGWWRDTAKRLLVQKADKSVAAAITELIQTTTDPLAQINALWTLEGLNALNLDSVRSALGSVHKKVKISGIELVTRLSAAEQQLLSRQLLEFVSDDYEVALQVALIAGQLQADNFLTIIKDVLEHHADKPLINEALASGSSGREQVLKETLAEDANTELLTLLASIGQQQLDVSNYNNLTTREQSSYHRGKDLYEGQAACFSCHGMKGQGMAGMAPPLANSEWVTGSPERLLKVLLHGLMGPITVNGKEYNLTMIMPGYGGNAKMTNQDHADIATYIRNNWGNEAAVIKADLVDQVRQQTSAQTRPYHSSELMH